MSRNLKVNFFLVGVEHEVCKLSAFICKIRVGLIHCPSEATKCRQINPEYELNCSLIDRHVWNLVSEDYLINYPCVFTDWRLIDNISLSNKVEIKILLPRLHRQLE